MATNRELVDTFREWKNDLVHVVADYKDAIIRLDNVEKNFKTSNLEYAKSYLPFLTQIITVLAILGFLLYFSNRVDCGVSIEVFGAKISRVCQSPSAAK